MTVKLLVVQEAAEQLRTDRWQVYRWISEGALRATKPGRRWLIAQADVDEYLASTANRAPRHTGRRPRRML